MFELIVSLFAALNKYDACKRLVDIGKDDFYVRLDAQSKAFNEVHAVLNLMWAKTKEKWPTTWFYLTTKENNMFGAGGHYQKMMWEMHTK